MIYTNLNRFSCPKKIDKRYSLHHKLKCVWQMSAKLNVAIVPILNDDSEIVAHV